MWRKSDLKDDTNYRLQLCQGESGIRYFGLISDDDYVNQLNPGDDVCYTTDIIDNSLLISRDLFEISLSTMTDSGIKFTVDSHGIWLTEREEEELANFISGKSKSINWSTSIPPKFAPK